MVKWSEVAQSCMTLCDPMDCSLSGSSIHGIFQARALEWVAISFSRGSSQPRDQTQVSRIVGRRFTVWATNLLWKARTQEQPHWRRCIGWGVGKRNLISALSLSVELSPNLHVFTNPETFLTLSLWVFFKEDASWHRNGWLNHRPLGLIHPPSFLLTREIRRVRLKVPTL